VDRSTTLSRALELYKCIALTVIAVTLGVIALRTQRPVTFGDLRGASLGERAALLHRLPVVRVQGATVDVGSVNQPVEIERP